MNRFRNQAGCLLLFALGTFIPLARAQNISFTQAANSPIAVGNRPSSVAVADFNGDGNLDVAAVNANDNSISVLLGNGNGTFTPASNSPVPVVACFLCNSVPTAISVGDFNGDGKADLAVTEIPVGPLSLIGGAITGHVGGEVAVLLGKGNGTFNGSNTFTTGGDLPVSLAVADLNGDGNTDVAVTNLNSGNVSILLGNGSGTAFSLKSKFGVGTRPASIAIGDFDSNGTLDLAVATADDNAIAIMMGNGDGTFAANANSPVAVSLRPDAVVVADFNGDGKLDLAAADLGASAVSVSLGDGTGTFPTVVDYSVGRYPTSIAVADFNNDGKLDLVVSDSLSHMVSILPGAANGTFGSARHIAVEGNPQSLAVGDFNGGQPDLVVANVGSNNLTVLLNTTDIIPPTTTATVSPAANSNGWNNSSVNVTLAATDNTGGSGVKEVDYAIGGNAQTTTATSVVLPFNSEVVFNLSYFAKDKAGNVESNHSLAVKIDKTPPSITASQSPPPNAAGWNNSNVTVSFTCSDALSQIASCSSPITLSTEGANQNVSGTARDRADNTATASATVSLDKTPPVLTMPALAPSYTYNASLTLSFGASDALSGLASQLATFNGATVSGGATLTLNHPGTNTFTLTAADIAENSATQSATFSVLYLFGGLRAPIPNDGSGVFKLGSTVPVKFPLTDANGAPVSTAIARLTLQMFSGGAPLGTPVDATPPGNADVGDLFRYDGSQYIYNLSTKPLSVGTWQLQVHLDDGTVHTVLIGVK